MIIRPKDWEATSDEAVDFLNSIQRPKHYYRGMTDQEYKATVGKGDPVQSTGAFSHSSEGTNFSEYPADAESYVNFGRDDPRRTGKSNWLVEVAETPTMYRDTDGYYKDKEPVDTVTRIWEFYPEDGAIKTRKVKGSDMRLVNRVALRHLFARYADEVKKELKYDVKNMKGVETVKEYHKEFTPGSQKGGAFPDMDLIEMVWVVGDGEQGNYTVMCELYVEKGGILLRDEGPQETFAGSVRGEAALGPKGGLQSVRQIQGEKFTGKLDEVVGKFDKAIGKMIQQLEAM